MSSDLNNNGFEELIRKKLEDYKTPVNASNWDVIEKSLLRRKRLKYIYTATGIVAAAAVLLLITLNLPYGDNQPNDKQTIEISTPATMPSDDKQNAAVADIDEQTVKESTTPENQTPENQAEQEQPASTVAPAYSATTNAVTAQIEKSDTYPEDPPVKDRLRLVPQTISGTSISISSSNKLQLPNNVHLTGTLNGKQDKDNNNHVRHDDKKDLIANLDNNKPDSKKWSVAMSFGAGNYQPQNVNTKNSDLIMSTPLLTSSNSVEYIRNKYRDEIKIPDNADAQHGLPLSAKFIVRKDFNARWAIESGVSYTYLSTKYKWTTNTVNQQLHYIGIPLNAVCYVVSKPKWNIYASAGGMLEKGVYSLIKRGDGSAQSRINGLQWSVNGAIGTTYKLHKGVGLFFEPQFGYFFDNGQPESIRTEWPVSFGLGIGLRFNF
jgi:hypothetical protein